MGRHQRLERRQRVLLRPRRDPGSSVCCLFGHQRRLIGELALDGRHHGGRDLSAERGGADGEDTAAARLDQARRRRRSSLLQCGTDWRPLASTRRREVYLINFRVFIVTYVSFLQHQNIFVLQFALVSLKNHSGNAEFECRRRNDRGVGCREGALTLIRKKIDFGS